MARLEGKTAVVIAAGTGIGRSVAHLFAREGADLLIADHGRTGELDSLADDLRAMGRKVLTAEVDVRRETEVKTAIERAADSFGRLDILVNNAGIAIPKGPFVSKEADSWDDILDINLRGVSHGMRHALPIMIAQGTGSIINTSSQLGHKPAPGNSFYCASKAAVIALSVSVAQEVAPLGVRVNVVCPGPTDTAMWRAGDPKWAEWKLESLPIRRVGTPDEVAWAYVYLASDEASFMIGQSVSPNGGDVMW